MDAVRRLGERIRGRSLRDDEKRYARKLLLRIGFQLLVWSLVFLVLLPIVWLIVNTLESTTLQQLIRSGVGSWLRDVDPSAYVGLLSTQFPRYLLNSFLVATVSAAITVGCCSIGAYSLARFQFRGRTFVAIAILLFAMVPQALLIVPLFLVFQSVGLHNSLIGLVVSYVGFFAPFAVWFLRGQFARLPAHIEEAAMVDGCSRLGAVFRIVLPVARGALTSTFLLVWFLAYNEFLFAYVLITSPAKRTLPIGIVYGVGGSVLAAAVVATVPILLGIVLFGQYLRMDLAVSPR